MKTTEFHLKRVVIKSYDDDYGKWILCHEDFIITERGNNEIYIGMPNIFRDFEQMIEEEKIGIKKYASYTIKRVFKIEGRGAYIKTIYNKVKHYGGSEEGGWYYDTMEATKLTAEEVELDTDRYDQYYVLEREFYFGENENLESQHYC